MEDQEKQQIFTFEKLESEFCLISNWKIKSAIKTAESCQFYKIWCIVKD